PSRTATFPNALIGLPSALSRSGVIRAWDSPARSSQPPDAAHLWVEVDTRLRFHRRANMLDQQLDVGGARAPIRVHDEIGMFLRHASAADRESFQSARFDESRGVIAVR